MTNLALFFVGWAVTRAVRWAIFKGVTYVLAQRCYVLDIRRRLNNRGGATPGPAIDGSSGGSGGNDYNWTDDLTPVHH